MQSETEDLMHDDRIDGSQAHASAEITAAVVQSREAAERLWAAIGRLLTSK